MDSTNSPGAPTGIGYRGATVADAGKGAKVMFKVLVWAVLIFIAAGALGVWLQRLRGRSGQQ